MIFQTKLHFLITENTNNKNQSKKLVIYNKIKDFLATDKTQTNNFKIISLIKIKIMKIDHIIRMMKMKISAKIIPIISWTSPITNKEIKKADKFLTMIIAEIKINFHKNRHHIVKIDLTNKKTTSIRLNNKHSNPQMTLIKKNNSLNIFKNLTLKLKKRLTI